MKDRGDAVGDRLPVAFQERDVDRKSDARPRHHLPLERVAVNVDDAREGRKRPRGVDVRSASRGRAEPVMVPVSESRWMLVSSSRPPMRVRPPSMRICMIGGPMPPSWRPPMRRVTGRRLCYGQACVSEGQASYLSRKRSIDSRRKSGKGRPQPRVVPVPPCQPLQAVRSLTGKRGRMTRAGLPATMA